MFKAFLIKYGEIALKGKNRYLFENKLLEHIRHALQAIGDFHIQKEQGRIYIEGTSPFDYEEAIDALKNIFGIAAICPVVLVENNEWEELKPAVSAYVSKVYGDGHKKLNQAYTFKVETRRADKTYPYDSMTVSRKMGAHLLDDFEELTVDVHKPDIRLNIEIRNQTYIYSLVIPGLGGMPVGTNGKAMLLLSGGIDSPVAGYMVAKRGVSIDAVYFHAPPYTSDRAKQKVVDLAKIVSKYAGPIKLHVVPFTEIQLSIYEKCPHDELTIIMRRIMMRIAEAIAEKSNAKALVTGESIGQVASQTLQSLAATNAVCKLPVFRPVIGFDKQEIVDIAQKINSYETSILPYEDCCTIFVAKHPVTKPNIKYIEKSEEKLIDIEEQITCALRDTEVIDI